MSDKLLETLILLREEKFGTDRIPPKLLDAVIEVVEAMTTITQRLKTAEANHAQCIAKTRKAVELLKKSNDPKALKAAIELLEIGVL